jgi:hypothetical protein
LSAVRRFAPGEPVVLRDVWRGRIWAARPVVLVQDDPDQLAFCVFPGTHWKGPLSPGASPLDLREGGWRLVDRLWAGSTILSFAWPGTPHAVLLYYEQATGALLRFYVNLQDPLRRTRIGFDTTDHILDAVVEPDRSSWRWKDRDDLAEAVDRGLFTPDQAESFFAEGERAVARIVDGEPPFDRDWATWEPEATWPLPRLVSGWDEAEP